MNGPSDAVGQGKLVLNVMHFARILREAGLPIGPGAVLDAVEAVTVAGIGRRSDMRVVLHAVFVKTHEHSVVFHQAFDLFWRRRNFTDKMIAAMSPMAEPKNAKKNKAEAGATRVSDAINKVKREERPAPSPELTSRLTVSGEEQLRAKDFAQMSAAEIAEARALIARLVLPRDVVPSRRFAPDPRGRLIDPRRSFRRSLRDGGAGIALVRQSPATRHPPVVAICDISGSMADYTRIFLHFLHALTAQRRVYSFLFGTRLTNVTRALRARDPDEALALCGGGVKDWAGGTRIAPSLHLFNKHWSRRVLGQGAIVILFTDGLEREGVDDLGREVDRLRRSCRRLIWVNPLLRFSGFEAKAQGIRAMLPHVDEFRPIHNLRSMAELCRALGDRRAVAVSPRTWLSAAA